MLTKPHTSAKRGKLVTKKKENSKKKKKPFVRRVKKETISHDRDKPTQIRYSALRVC